MQKLITARSHGWFVNISSGNGLVPSSNKSLSELTLTKFYDTHNIPYTAVIQTTIFT